MSTGSDVLVTTLVMLAERRGRPGEAVPDADLICYLAAEVASLEARLAGRDAPGTRAWANIDEDGCVRAMSTVPTSACRYPVRIVADPEREVKT